MSTRATLELAGAGLGLGLLLVAAVLLQAARADAREARLDGRNARAAADTTRRALVAGRLVQRRLVEEHEVQLDGVARRLQAERSSRATADVQISLLEGQIRKLRAAARTTRDSAGATRVVDTLDARDSLGIRAAVDVSVPADSGQATVLWWIERGRADFQLTLGCGPENAEATLIGPPYLRAELTRVQQDDEICVPKPGFHLFTLRAPSLPVGLGLLGAGAALWEILRPK